jgi:hypothetical protein
LRASTQQPLERRKTALTLIKRGSLTKAGKEAAAEGQREYQKLVDRFDGKVHLSRGRAAAVNARLKLSQGSKPRPADILGVPNRLVKPTRKGNTTTSRKTSKDEAVSGSEAEGDAGETVTTFDLLGEAREQEKTEPTISTRTLACNGLGRRGKRKSTSDSDATRSKRPEKPQPHTNARKQSKKRNTVRVSRARLLELAVRYKDNHNQFHAQQQVDDSTSTKDVPEGEFEIEQIMCSDVDGALLVKWAGYERPSWEPTSSIPVGARNSYLHQGHVELVEYLALLDVAC